MNIIPALISGEISSKLPYNKRMPSDFGKLRSPQPLMRGVRRYRKISLASAMALSTDTQHSKPYDSIRPWPDIDELRLSHSKVVHDRVRAQRDRGHS